MCTTDWDKRNPQPDCMVFMLVFPEISPYLVVADVFPGECSLIALLWYDAFNIAFADATVHG